MSSIQDLCNANNMTSIKAENINMIVLIETISANHHLIYNDNDREWYHYIHGYWGKIDKYIF